MTIADERRLDVMRMWMQRKKRLWTGSISMRERGWKEEATYGHVSRDGSPFVALDRSIAVAAGQILCASRISLQTSQTLTMSLSCRHEV
jgi:hypothetical protein